MNVPLLDLKAQYATIREDVREAIDRVFESQRFVLGTEGQALEEELPDTAKPGLRSAARPARMRCCSR